MYAKPLMSNSSTLHHMHFLHHILCARALAEGGAGHLGELSQYDLRHNNEQFMGVFKTILHISKLYVDQIWPG